MIDKFCAYLTKKIRKEMPEVDDEREEVIMYGLQNIIGELPKFCSKICSFYSPPNKSNNLFPNSTGICDFSVRPAK